MQKECYAALWFMKVCDICEQENTRIKAYFCEGNKDKC